MSKQEAIALRENVKNMTPEARRDWYRAEKLKRKQENFLAKRTFSQPKGELKQTSQNAGIVDVNTIWDTFEDYAIRMIALRRCEDEEGAQPLWQDALQAVGAIVMTKNGRLVFSLLTSDTLCVSI